MDLDQDIGGALHNQGGKFAQLVLIGRSMLGNVNRTHFD